MGCWTVYADGADEMANVVVLCRVYQKCNGLVHVA